MKVSLKIRVFALVCFLVTFTVIALFIVLRNDLDNRLHEDFKERGLIIADYFARNSVEGIIIEDEDGLSKTLEKLFEIEDIIYAGIYDNEGTKIVSKETVFVSDSLSITGVEDSLNEIVSRIMAGRKNEFRVLDFKIATFDEEHERIGWVRVGINLQRITTVLDKMMIRSLTMLVFFIIIALVISFLMANSIANPINEVAGAIRSFGKGDFNSTVQTTRDDELGQLAMGFNQMAESLKSRTEELQVSKDKLIVQADDLQEAHDKLEVRVKERTEELRTAQKELVDKAHRAGMADIATGTLHNVGNILNSVKSSAQVINNLAKNSEVSSLKKANDLLREHIDSIEEFITTNPKGKKLMHYYLKLEESFISENNEMHKHLKRLNDKVDAIVEVIAAQQTYAGKGSLTEEYAIVDIIEDALMMQSGHIERYGITVIKNYNKMPKIPLQRVKLVHILINLINNATEAMYKASQEERKLIVSVDIENNGVYIRFKDSGQGIAKSNLKKVFSQGFTTRKNGHGFGLHSSANYMTEMQGEMWAESDGIGKGTTLTLKFLLDKNTVA